MWICKKDQICTDFVDLKDKPFGRYCAQLKCSKEKDCSTLDDPKLKHKPAKCENKKCKYDPYLVEYETNMTSDEYRYLG